jgi:hypothetical protein
MSDSMKPWLLFAGAVLAVAAALIVARGDSESDDELYGPSVTWLVKHGDRFTADFPPVTVPCAYPRGSSYPRHSSGQSHDSYKLRWSHDHSTLLAVEHRVQTGCYAGTSTPDLTRWRAAKVG